MLGQHEPWEASGASKVAQSQSAAVMASCRRANANVFMSGTTPPSSKPAVDNNERNIIVKP